MPLFTLICRLSDKLLLVESMDSEENADYTQYRKKGKQLFYRMTPNTEPAGVIVDDPYFFMYLIDNDICYLTFCDKMNKKIVYKYLEEIKSEFCFVHGNDLKQKRLRPFSCQSFDSFIQKTKKMYRGATSKNLNQVASDLKDISKLVQQNIQDIIDRGAKIERVAEKSDDLVNETKRFHKQTNDLLWQQLLRSYGYIAFIVGFFLFLIIFLLWYRG